MEDKLLHLLQPIGSPTSEFTEGGGLSTSPQAVGMLQNVSLGLHRLIGTT
jgi:hypothetical protein